MKKYGIMGGTFNPIHLGHLMISEYIREDMQLNEIIFVPTGNPPHKKTTDAELRYRMVELAVEENQYFSISDIEVRNSDISYTVDTITKLEKELDGKIYFIIGSDTLFQLKTWKKIDLLFEKVEFICAIRPEYVSTQILDLELKYLKQKYKAEIHIVETPLYEISSTDLRNRISKGKSVKYLIPDKVIDYIKEKELYK
ncbi:nicotinate-nucleotide adenylyltransferase [Peptoniphilus asaccharolyticus DSM 20463]|uniref:Probable nicotinate-nucleotide adenylyltransferase n=1 Tax=Peptoniphilus asaccharolyticus DSM 20463 TaxID=573058 RepID=A0A1W1UV48_PEPAS|nr:nicotinate-nucleotide adenylyltransferase [Peptoniphilus asaccharolyticus]MBL7575234.1 nicotinate-nucleotide adenylyltransferase [Peptoniphilus asaccharolyticus]SMB84953.1 nicotinate-nucleotide adenylyltransferase [Peptoniphilus asaccharolyticus DSM 20463]